MPKGRSAGRRAASGARSARGQKPVGALVLTDALLVVAALLVFALFHHVLPREMKAVGTVSLRGGAQAASAPTIAASPEATATPDRTAMATPEAAATPEPIALPEATETPEPTVEPTPEASPEPQQAAQDQQADPVGYFGNKFADKFTGGTVIQGDGFYQSANLNVSIKEGRAYDASIFVVDIYVRDISNYVTAFAKDSYGRGIEESPKKIAARVGGVVAINGDYYGARDDMVIRNGMLYRDAKRYKRDVCVLYWDGRMVTYDASDFSAQAAMDQGAYQAWSFGPRLLDDAGNAMTKFNSDVSSAHPRTAIGYFEPGHYCFVVAEGRVSDSAGLSLKNLSAFMAALGCKAAFNLDGGATSQLVFMGDVVNRRASGGRDCSDIITVVDSQSQN